MSDDNAKRSDAAASDAALVDREIWFCNALLDRPCPKRWDGLGEIGDGSVRQCAMCNELVYLCQTPTEFVRHAELGHCVAIPADVTLGSTHRPLGLGRPPRELTERADAALVWWNAVIDQRLEWLHPDLVRVRRILRSR
ncbi:MAG TPA: hypothetical protein PK999_18670 [Nitrospira sp.]|nr:hypothetical protein [Nitrospira sp.]